VDNSRNPTIYVGLGGNMAHPDYGSPIQTLTAALADLSRRDIIVQRLSPWYRSAPVPVSEQPWFVNAVAEVTTNLSPDRLLEELHAVEGAFGRVRTVANAPRAIDLDLLDYRGAIARPGSGRAVLPHPRLAERAFVLRPLADLAPEWRHPVSGKTVQALVAALPADQVTERL
jgi:2-amino-4-hydroxy-6-hydroxymethyldihydropteridine diphosphokinase